MRPLTPLQKQCLSLIDRQQSGGGKATYVSIAAAMGLKSKSGVHRIVQQLIDAGYVRMRPGRSGIEILKRADLTGHLRDLMAQHGVETVSRAFLAARESAPPTADMGSHISRGQL